jgi:hypothetical protein
MQNQNSKNFFEDIPVIGKLPPNEIALKLREIGDFKGAQEIETASSTKGLFGGKTPAWKNTAHAFGYIPPVQAGSTVSVPITHAGNITPDATLKNKRVKIALGALRVAEYPGGGIHNILFDFYAQNQLPNNQTEDLHFNQTYRVMQGQSAGIIGYPIFVGLNVGSTGVTFKCYTVNVTNADDQSVLNILDSGVFKNGLKLATTAQPAIAPLAEIAVGVTKMLATRHNNQPVQDIYMGLDFTNIPYTARLAEGAYIAVQIPQEFTTKWNWNDWVYTPENGLIVQKNDPTALIPYNYIVFNVSRYEEP